MQSIQEALFHSSLIGPHENAAVDCSALPFRAQSPWERGSQGSKPSLPPRVRRMATIIMEATRCPYLEPPICQKSLFSIAGQRLRAWQSPFSVQLNNHPVLLTMKARCKFWGTFLCNSFYWRAPDNVVSLELFSLRKRVVLDVVYQIRIYKHNLHAFLSAQEHDALLVFRSGSRW